MSRPVRVSVAAIRERACEDKARLSDEAAARAVAMRQLQAGSFRGRKAWVYACGWCRGFHITSKYQTGNRPGAVTAENALVTVKTEARA